MSADRTIGPLGDTLALILAGGRGKRLHPLTSHRTKGAVPFGGVYRLIDFTLSNCLHSGVHRICVLPQYKFASLERHLRLGWGDLFRPQLGGSLALVPPQQRVGQDWYRGTADAVYQNVYTMRQESRRYALILSSDHIYRMDYRPLLEYHAAHGAAVTLACMEVGLDEAGRYGIMAVDGEDRIRSFEEKPGLPTPMAGRPSCALASMGVYVFDTDALIELVEEDAESPDTSWDFGKDIVPRMVARGQTVRAFNVSEHPDANPSGTRSFYWRDIGVLDAYWRASLELVMPNSQCDLHDRNWPICTYQACWPPARIEGSGAKASSRISDSMLCPGSSVTHARVHRSILSPGVVVDHAAEVVESVLMDGVRVGPGARVYRAIVDKGVQIPADYCIGVYRELDRIRFLVTAEGVTVLPRETQLQREAEGTRLASSFFGVGRPTPVLIDVD